MDKDKIKVWYDEETDILYVSFRKGSGVDSEEIRENIRVEYGKKGEVMGVEIHHLTKMVAKSLMREIKEMAKL
ncbi:DUF2283 domain-containing protein [bacterium]|nr:MAG: DUF2283 domain-containing protein [bacterium]